MAILPMCRYADIGDCRYADIADIFRIEIHRNFADVAQNADIQISAISALKMFADSRYVDIGQKCRYNYRHVLSIQKRETGPGARDFSADDSVTMYHDVWRDCPPSK